MSLTPSARADHRVAARADGAQHGRTSRPGARTLGLFALIAAVVRCGGRTGTVDIPNATLALTTTADIDNVIVPEDVPVTATVGNVFLVDPTDTPPPEHAADAAHLEFHLDDESRPALLETSATYVLVPIAADTLPGRHDVICRVHKHDGTPTSTKSKLWITVKTTPTTAGDGHPIGGAGGYGGFGGRGGEGGGGVAGFAGPVGGQSGSNAVGAGPSVDAGAPLALDASTALTP